MHATTQPLVTTTLTKTYRIGGSNVVCEDKPANNTNVAIATYTKASCNKMSVCEATSLIQMICGNQQVKFKDVSINTTDLEKLNKTHSLKLLITKLRTDLARYNLLAGFMINKCTNFVTGKLEVHSSAREAIY